MTDTAYVPLPEHALDWQPIATVPSTAADGLRVDLWMVPAPDAKSGRKSRGRAKAFRLTDAYHNGSEGSGWTNFHSYNHRVLNYVATHWRLTPEPPTNGHTWFDFHNTVACRTCGIVRRRDGANAPCRGPVRVALRAATVKDV